MGFFKYLKHAFVNRWNLLAFSGAMAFGFISGRPDIVVPLCLAGEMLYVGLLGTHPKFQHYVDAQEAKAVRQEGQEQNQEALKRIMQSLPRASLARFEALRSCCAELRQIASSMKNPGTPSSEPLEDLQLGRLDQLMWMFLRLLYTEHSLERFLQKTDPREITRDIDRLQDNLAALPADAADPRAAKIRKALEDNLATCRDRQANLQKAADNLQMVRLEVDRLENKIRALSELAINRQEPQYISDQVDQIATSLLETEKTMNDLDFATGLTPLDDVAPSLVRNAPPALPTKKTVTQ